MPEKSGLRIAVWCLDAHDCEGHEESFLSEVREFHVVPPFSSPDDLRAQIEERLYSVAAEDWRLGASLAISYFAPPRSQTAATRSM